MRQINLNCGGEETERQNVFDIVCRVPSLDYVRTEEGVGQEEDELTGKLSVTKGRGQKISQLCGLH